MMKSFPKSGFCLYFTNCILKDLHLVKKQKTKVQYIALPLHYMGGYVLLCLTSFRTKMFRRGQKEQAPTTGILFSGPRVPLVGDSIKKKNNTLFWGRKIHCNNSIIMWRVTPRTRQWGGLISSPGFCWAQVSGGSTGGVKFEDEELCPCVIQEERPSQRMRLDRLGLLLPKSF